MNWQEALDGLRNASPATAALRNAGSWPPWAKVAATVAVLGLVLGGGRWLLAGSMQRLELAENREADLRRAYEHKSARAAYLSAYRHRHKRLEAAVASLRALLPRDSEVPGLLEDITRAAADSGLVVRGVDLQPERREEFYVELPVEISVQGGYHEIGAFVSRMAALRRLVTLHDFHLEAQRPSGALSLNLLARTYGRPPAKGDVQ